jgi:hypothetical protein
MKKSDRGAYFKIYVKPNDHILEIRNLRTKFK